MLNLDYKQGAQYENENNNFKTPKNFKRDF
jgi:hypothetical protein